MPVIYQEVLQGAAVTKGSDTGQTRVRHDYLCCPLHVPSDRSPTMASLPRYAPTGQPQRIIQRGNNRQVIFATDADYQFFRDAIEDGSS